MLIVSLPIVLSSFYQLRNSKKCLLRCLLLPRLVALPSINAFYKLDIHRFLKVNSLSGGYLVITLFYVVGKFVVRARSVQLFYIQVVFSQFHTFGWLQNNAKARKIAPRCFAVCDDTVLFSFSLRFFPIIRTPATGLLVTHTLLYRMSPARCIRSFACSD